MPQLTVLPSGQQVPVNTVFVIGRNYLEDPRERAEQAGRPPTVCLKPTSAVILEGEPIRLPSFSECVNFEIELLVLIGKGGRDIPLETALEHVLGYGVGLDLTDRELHQQAKEQGQPWTVCKGFDTAAPMSAFLDAAEVDNPQAAEFALHVNEQLRQRGNASQMVYSIARIIQYLSTIFTLRRGDVIYTGTPAGADCLRHGDRLRLRYLDRIEAGFPVAAPTPAAGVRRPSGWRT